MPALHLANDRTLSSPAPESLTIDPAPERWLDTLRTRPALTDAQLAFRRELGLPTNTRIVMTGHQAEFWHVGILAKYFAADAAARAAATTGTPASTAWLIVDHDANEPGHIRVPVLRRDDRAGIDHLAELALHLGVGHAHGLSACQMPALAPTDAELARVQAERSPTPEIAVGLDRMVALLRQHANASNAAEQHARVLRDLLASFDLHAPVLHATSLSRTVLFRDLIARMVRDPEACVHAYNAAVAAVPQAGLTPLLADIVQDRFELPLWRLAPRQPRARVYVEDLSAIPPDELAPRALFMTALLRHAGCDLFIHGLGGGIYDHATELWFCAWLPDAMLAPTAVVTATRYLPFPPMPAAEPLATALWRLHHARHDPALLGDPTAAERKGELVHQIAAAKAASKDPKPLYRAMLSLLERARDEHADGLQAVAAAADRSRALANEQSLRRDRTWPFPLHGEVALRALQHEINTAFGLPSRPDTSGPSL